MSDDPVEIINSAVREFEAGQRDCLAAAAITPPEPSGPILPTQLPLRDVFAIAALKGLLAIPSEWRGYIHRDGLGTTWKAEAASSAYALADAMLAAREKPP